MKTRSPRLMLALAAFALAACATLAPAQRIERVPTPDEAIAAYARVLEQFVNPAGEVDFAALSRQARDLETYVAFIAATPASSFAPAERLAHYINSYNALSMYNVIRSGLPRSHAGFAKLRFFVLRRFEIGGESRSLYGYENDVIRPLGDPRVHFALNCSAVSCPVLPRQPFSAAQIDAELDREARAFFARAENFRIDHDTRAVYLNEIMAFYTEDFVPRHAPSLIAYVNRYAPQRVPADYAVKFVPYDWTVADSRRPR